MFVISKFEKKNYDELVEKYPMPRTNEEYFFFLDHRVLGSFI